MGHDPHATGAPLTRAGSARLQNYAIGVWEMRHWRTTPLGRHWGTRGASLADHAIEVREVRQWRTDSNGDA